MRVSLTLQLLAPRIRSRSGLVIGAMVAEPLHISITRTRTHAKAKTYLIGLVFAMGPGTGLGKRCAKPIS